MSKNKVTRVTMLAEICLYGNRQTGAGWLAVFADRMAGDGEPVADRSFTEAVWLAAEALKKLGAPGKVAIYAPGGEKMAICDLSRVPSYGDLRWQPAPQHEIGEAMLVAAAAGL